jgi:hypothetical protein
LNILILAIIAVIEKTTVLAETAIRLNAIDHNSGLNDDLGVNAIIGLSDKR